jgi:hypothetical protein
MLKCLTAYIGMAVKSEESVKKRGLEGRREQNTSLFNEDLTRH